MDSANDAARSVAAELGISLPPLVEQIGADLDHAVPRAQIEGVLIELLRECRGAKVTAYLPLLLRRHARERLRTQTNAGSELRSLHDVSVTGPAGAP